MKLNTVVKKFEECAVFLVSFPARKISMLAAFGLSACSAVMPADHTDHSSCLAPGLTHLNPDIAKKISLATVWIFYNPDGPYSYEGTGVIIKNSADPGGFDKIYTSQHLLSHGHGGTISIYDSTGQQYGYADVDTMGGWEHDTDKFVDTTDADYVDAPKDGAVLRVRPLSSRINDYRNAGLDLSPVQSSQTMIFNPKDGSASFAPNVSGAPILDTNGNVWGNAHSGEVPKVSETPVTAQVYGYIGASLDHAHPFSYSGFVPLPVLEHVRISPLNNPILLAALNQAGRNVKVQDISTAIPVYVPSFPLNYCAVLQGAIAPRAPKNVVAQNSPQPVP